MATKKHTSATAAQSDERKARHPARAGRVPGFAEASAATFDRQSWRQGVRLALDLLNAADDLDEMSLESDCRKGRPQKNVVAEYLDRLREIDDRQVHLAFGAVMSDFIAGACGGSIASTEFLKSKARKPIATEIRE